MSDSSATINAISCKHRNGWYHRVPFWIFFRLVYVCSDCGKMLYGKQLDNWYIWGDENGED